MSFVSDISKNIPKKYLDLLPKLQEEKTKNFTTITFTLIALSFFGIFAISPTLSTIAQLKKELTDNIFVNEKLQEKIVNLSILSQEYSLLSDDLSIILSAIPQKPNTAILIGQIQTLAKNSNIIIQKIQSYEVELTKKAEETDQYSSYAFSIEGQAGSYKDINLFLSSMINFDRLTTIDIISVNNQSESLGEEQTLSFSIRGKAYFKR
ncbi:MAG: type 4a pilus biogenesis protein PilO [Candidatus Levyibacteriota bacterium]